MIFGTGLGRDNGLDHINRDNLLPLLCNRRVEIRVEDPRADPWGTKGNPFKQWLDDDDAKNLGGVPERNYSGYGIGRFPNHDESWAILAEPERASAPNPSTVTKLDLR
jgi:hypothetical protein